MKLKHGTPCYSFEDNGLRSVEINTRWQVLDSPILKGFLIICGALHGLVRFVQFKKREKHPWKSVTFSNTPPWMFFTFFKLYKWYQTAQRISYND